MLRSTKQALGVSLAAFVALATLYVFSHDGARLLVGAPGHVFAYALGLVVLSILADYLVESGRSPRNRRGR